MHALRKGKFNISVLTPVKFWFRKYNREVVQQSHFGQRHSNSRLKILQQKPRSPAWSGCLACVREFITVTFCQDTVLTTSKMPLWLELKWAMKAFLLNVWTAPWFFQNDFLMITQPINAASDLPSPKLLAGGFSTPCIYLFMLFASNYLLHSLGGIHHGGWTKHVTHWRRSRNVLGLIFTLGLTHVQTTTEASLPRYEHLPVSCLLILPHLMGYS